MDDPNLDKLLQVMCEIRSDISKIDNRLNVLESQVSQQQKNLLGHMAENISGVIGLREAVTWDRKPIKYAWAALLCFGLAATVLYLWKTTAEYLGNPTATSVILERKSDYAYPSLILCPSTWLDAEKALSRGLTMDGLKHSLRYAFHVEEFNDTKRIANARRAFEKFYAANNYSSLLDYYKDITVDISQTELYLIFAGNISSPAYACYGCKGLAEKVFVRDSMCYAFEFKPANGNRFYTSATVPGVVVKVPDRTLGVIPKLTSDWLAYVMPDKRVVQPTFLPIALKPSAQNAIKVSAQRFVTLSKDNAKCFDPEEVGPKYSSDRCVIECFQNIFKARYNCSVFSYAFAYQPEPPSSYCSHYDYFSGSNQSFLEAFASIETSLDNSNKSERCIKSCAPKCDRIIFTSIFDSAFPMDLGRVDFDRYNASYLAVNMDHTAISQGGILTLTEVSTFSFATLVSNVGGTLGLFVGGTIMTLFQLILFFVNHALDKKAQNGSARGSAP